MLALSTPISIVIYELLHRSEFVGVLGGYANPRPTLGAFPHGSFPGGVHSFRGKIYTYRVVDMCMRSCREFIGMSWWIVPHEHVFFNTGSSGMCVLAEGSPIYDPYILALLCVTASLYQHSFW